MTPKRFDEIVQFCKETGIKLVYGVNGMGGRYKNTKADWDYKNSFQLLNFIKEKRYVEDGYIYGLELGNELDYSITPEQQVEDFIIFKKEIERLWPNEDQRPKIVGPDTTTVKPEYIGPLIEKGLLDVITYHFCIL